MNMISTGAFLPETDASTKQNELVKKLTSAWEKKNSKTARAGGASLMALSLAACGGEDNTPFSAADVSAAEAAATTAALTGADGTVYASVDAAVTSNDTAIADAARAEGVASVDITTDNQAAIDAAVAAVDLTTDNAAATDAAVAADTAFASLSALVAAYNALTAPAGASIAVKATDEVIGGLTVSSDTITATTATYSSSTVIVDSSSSDSDVFSLTITADDDIDGTVAGIETINVTVNYTDEAATDDLDMSLSGVAAGTAINFNHVAGSVIAGADITNAKTTTLNFSSLFNDVDVTGANNADLTIDLARASEASASTLVIQGATPDAVTVTSAGDLTISSSTSDGALSVTTLGDADITAATATSVSVTSEDEAIIRSMAAAETATISSTGSSTTASQIIAAGSLETVNISGNAGANYVTVTAGGAAITTANFTGDQTVELVVSGADHDDTASKLTAVDSTTAGTTTVNFSAASTSGTIDTTAIGADQIQLSADFDTEAITFGTGQSFLISASQNTGNGVTMTSALATASTNTLSITIDDDDATTTTAQTIELDALAVTNTKTTTITSSLDNLLLDTSISVGAGNNLVMNLAGTLTNGTGETITAGSLDASGSSGAATLFLSGGVATVKTGSGADTLTIEGTATGGTTVELNAGDDTLNSIDESITVDGGAGVDTVAYAATANLTGQTFALTNVEVVDIDSAGAANTLTVDSADVTGDTYTLLSSAGGTNDAFTVTVDSATVDLSGISVEAADITVTINANAYTAVSAVTITGTNDADTINMTGGVGSTASGGGGADTITGGAGADTIDGGAGGDGTAGGAGTASTAGLIGAAGADTITGGEGIDVIHAGAGADTIILTETTAVTDYILTTDGLGSNDTVTGFTAGTSGDIIEIDLSDTNALAAGVWETVDAWGTAVVAGAVTASTVSAAWDAADITTSTELLKIGVNISSASALETALEDGGVVEMTSDGAAATGDIFMVAYSDGTNSYIAAVEANGAAADNGTFATGELTANLFLTLNGVDVDDLVAANFDIVA